MRDFIRKIYHRLYSKLNYDVQKNLLANGKILVDINNRKHNIKSLDEVEFQVFSQRGEDGIIQYIISKIEIPNKIFIEFGVENYTESNTRFLLFNNNWAGLVIDGSKSNIDFIKNDFIYWKYDIVAINEFITRDNINKLIADYTSHTDIGLLSVDIDGNDYWIWEAIDKINPRIVICEYNSAFGAEQKVSIPYKKDFYRTSAHYSNLYFGASLGAFCYLAEKKGYDFIGVGGGGVNAFFVRKDLSAPFIKYTSKEGYKESANRDSKDKDGRLSFLRHHERLNVIKNEVLINVENLKESSVSEIFGLK